MRASKPFAPNTPVRQLSGPGRAAAATVLALALGCGTTRMTDTQRTGTEQLLISNAIDQVVSQLDFHELAGKSVYFDPQYLEGTVDKGYLISSIRQHLLANGCTLQEERSKATYVVEARSGGVGTDRHSLLVGIPQTTVPAVLPGQPTQIPEIPFAKKTDQNGVAKLAVFAYNRRTGEPLWQSGMIQSVSRSKDLWLLGAGPFQHGTIRSGTTFAGGEPIRLSPFGQRKKPDPRPRTPIIAVTQAAAWPERAATPPPPSKGLAMLLGRGARRHPLSIDALILDSLNDPPSGSSATGKKGGASKSSSPPTPNSGGKDETQPHEVVNTGR